MKLAMAPAFRGIVGAAFFVLGYLAKEAWRAGGSWWEPALWCFILLFVVFIDVVSLSERKTT